ncbi:hypothetical protein RO3G_15045 [Rhizopus delemar RA 99-880]|uniref:Uncharacterized protein n=1 Tax=Rhizopus delemar (strain RA 99-880 / ATCC MYA-4621 / FGSC 9543 / NRRL 43880) TaxID=246409 RepID=I1CPF4_RHIO9|nr:hypothetical protein RO3G_15045 [Rhizopus delemar RA 99-880]|eukprot:EIE90334.1 hypothetical protein RO3G_15045 [Rhizopus delemar RA 99-880]
MKLKDNKKVIVSVIPCFLHPLEAELKDEQDETVGEVYPFLSTATLCILS